MTAWAACWRGETWNWDAYGVLDVSAAPAAPVEKDLSIFRLASMTKPIVGAAMMILWEEGKWTLDDPVARHIPEFAGLKVKTRERCRWLTRPRPMTMAQLMSHSVGLGRAGDYPRT